MRNVSELKDDASKVGKRSRSRAEYYEKRITCNCSSIDIGEPLLLLAYL
jgi:hypothetical protein